MEGVYRPSRRPVSIVTKRNSKEVQGVCSPHPQEKQRGGIRSKGELCAGGVLDGHDDPRRKPETR